ncbi:MAG: hypothetical protein K9J06_01535 [Flavobacteriales bacterium]|nr:hypothetical protein [Flavobacteriales bacterium]
MLKFHHCPVVHLGPIVDKMLEGSLTGAVIEDMLAPETVQQLLELMVPLNGRFRTDLNHGNGFSLPGMFGQLHKHQHMHAVEDYFNDIGPFVQDAEELFGGGLQSLLEKALTRVLVPYSIQPLATLLPFSFRVVFAGMGGLSLHKDGDLLPIIHQSVEELIRTTIDPDTMMSWFFTLQQPERGGELWVADSSYGQHLKIANTTLQAPDGTLTDATRTDHIKVCTPVGSLLVFRGGNHWHSVVPPAIGCRDRITIGGFMALHRTEGHIVYWT